MLSDTWRIRVWREFHARNITRSFRDVLLTLSTYRGKGGNCVPSHHTLATRVGCSVRTVARALAHAQQLGLVTWSERRVRVGWRWLRSSNAYRLSIPDVPVEPDHRAAWPRRATTGQRCRVGESKHQEEAQEAHRTALARLMTEASRLPDLLARRRATIEQRLARA
jgi:DNA-binding transcriptional MocR family regulator